MLATLIIALREGLEAVLIVAIIASVLKNNQRSLFPLWIGVLLAVLLSIFIGGLLWYSEHSLPQTAQEAMETLIGIIAIIFLSSMLIWMQQNAGKLKQQLEKQVNSALTRKTQWALIIMAFLAVIREGFETSVFLIATVSTASSTIWPITGAITGLSLAVIMGIALYQGSLRLHLPTLFKFSGFLLILIAGGLVLSTLRSAHEAGWLVVGQQQVLNLSGIVTAGTLRASIITGLLGIPSDPRLTEVVGWLCYILFMLMWTHPALNRYLTKKVRRYIQILLALVFFAIATRLLYQNIGLQRSLQPDLPLFVNSDLTHLYGKITQRSSEQIQIVMPDIPAPQILHLNHARSQRTEKSGLIYTDYHWKISPEKQPKARELTLEEVSKLNGGRLPAGMSYSKIKHPITATPEQYCSIHVAFINDQLIQAKAETLQIMVLTGSGFGARTLRVKPENINSNCAWHTAKETGERRQQQLAAQQRVKAIAAWQLNGPSYLFLIAGISCLILAYRNWNENRRNATSNLL